MILTLGIIIWLVGIYVNAKVDAKLIKKKGIDLEGHIVETIVRCMIGIGWGVIFINPSNMRDYWPAFIFQATSFWILFELWLNYLIGKEWLFYGKTSLIDRFFQWTGPEVHFICKVIAVVLMGFSIYWMFLLHSYR